MANLHQGVAFSPQTTISENIGAADTIIKVSDSSVFPDPPNYATIGTDELGETIEYAAKAEGLLSGCTRGVEGTAKSWQKGDVIARNFTAKDHNDMISAVTTAQQTANNAASSAATAQQTADSAVTAAGAAQSSANTAQETADNAQSTANAAKTTAEAALPKSGGVMTGPITGITTPTVDTGAANKLYVDSSIDRQNLLDNACWISKKLIVNQRNVTSWKGGYGIDRWLNTEYKESAVVNVESSGIKLTSTVTGNSLGCVFSQKQLYDKVVMQGVPYTLSVLANIQSGYLSLSAANDTKKDYTLNRQYSAENQIKLYQYTFTTPSTFDDNDIMRFAFYQVGTGVSILYAAKLEPGEFSTLAHLDSNGNWILNEIPDYAAELLKCQRYFVNFTSGNKGNAIGYFQQYATSQFNLQIPLPATMRTDPVASSSGNLRVCYTTPQGTFETKNITYASFTGLLLRGSINYVIIGGNDSSYSIPIGSFGWIDILENNSYFNLSSEL